MCCTVSLQSQQPSSASTPASATVLVVARSKDGSPAELSADDIEIKVEGKAAVVQEVHRMAGVPLHYVLLFDTSGSRHERFNLQQAQAIRVLSKEVRAGRDQGLLVAFNDKAYLAAQGTNPQELVDAITHERSFGGTAFYDAAVSAANHLAQAADSAPRVMFVLSDGEDNASRVDRYYAEQSLLNARIRVYVIGQGKPYRRGGEALRLFSESTGGRAYFPAKREDEDAALADIANDLSNLFSVSYIPSKPADKRLQKIEVRCKKNDVSVAAPKRIPD
jgi:Ca-activated chloride channel homolog